MAIGSTEITWSLLVLLGCLSGFLSGLLGIGSGMILIPALIVSFPHLGIVGPATTRIAMATSLAVIIPTSIASTQMHALKGSIDWRLLLLFGPSIVAGASIAPVFAGKVSGPCLTGLFILFALYPAWGAMRSRTAPKNIPAAAGHSGPFKMAVAGLIGGAFSAMLGLGVAFFSVPMLSRFTSVQRAIGTAAALGLPMAIAGAIGYLLAPTPAECRSGCAGFIYLPAVAAIGISAVLAAPIGARLTQILPIVVLRRLFGVFLIAAAGYLTYKTLPIVPAVRASQQIIAAWLAPAARFVPVAAEMPRWLAQPVDGRDRALAARLAPQRVPFAHAEIGPASLSAESLLFLTAAGAAHLSSLQAIAAGAAAKALLPDAVDAGSVPMPERALRQVDRKGDAKPRAGKRRTHQPARTVTIALPERYPSCPGESATANRQHKEQLVDRLGCRATPPAPADAAASAFNPFVFPASQ